jgi:hypothetical protein
MGAAQGRHARRAGGPAGIPLLSSRPRRVVAAVSVVMAGSSSAASPDTPPLVSTYLRTPPRSAASTPWEAEGVRWPCGLRRRTRRCAARPGRPRRPRRRAGRPRLWARGLEAQNKMGGGGGGGGRGAWPRAAELMLTVHGGVVCEAREGRRAAHPRARGRSAPRASRAPTAAHTAPAAGRVSRAELVDHQRLANIFVSRA